MITRGQPSDGLDAASRRPRWLLWSVAATETLTLAVLLTNLAVAEHSPAVAGAIGPVHGGLYLLGVLLSWTSPLSVRTKIVAVVPVLGIWLAARQSSRPVPSSDQSLSL